MHEFEGNIPQYLNFEEGDVFTMPTKYDVLTEITPSGNMVHFINVLTSNGELRKLYPSMFYRRVKDMNDRTIRTDGTATDCFLMNGPSINDAMNSLKGKIIRVSKINKVQAPVFGRRNVYTFDFV